ncbi:MAG: N-acetyltransferase [Deltaproteobacteria bacterium]
MTETSSKKTSLQTPKGDIRIHSFCRPEQIQQYNFDRYFGICDDFKSLFTQRESLVKSAAKAGANLVLAIADERDIIGYGLLAYPDADERWASLGAEIMLEVKAIEVGRPWRSAGIAPEIMKRMLVYPRIEEKIIYMVGYSWTWDLRGKKLSGQEYRRMLIRLFEPFGFKEYETNEPNVSLRPENILMCRMGQNVPQTIRDRFKWLRFGLTPWTWQVD